MLALLLDLGAGRTAELGGFLLLTAAAFAALNQALVAWFGGVGRFLSVVLVVVGAAGAVTAAVPASFDVLRPFLPLTPALEGLRAIASPAAREPAGPRRCSSPGCSWAWSRACWRWPDGGSSPRSSSRRRSERRAGARQGQRLVWASRASG